jgi:hypothetical protein
MHTALFVDKENVVGEIPLWVGLPVTGLEGLMLKKDSGASGCQEQNCSVKKQPGGLF